MEIQQINNMRTMETFSHTVKNNFGIANLFPEHWGEPPALQTKDLIELPEGYGRGSSTLKAWILKNIEADKRT